MKDFLQRNNWWFYFVLTYALSWSVWYLGNLLLPADFQTLVIVLGVFGPLCAALLMIRLSGNRGQLKLWLRQVFNFRIPIAWYLLGALILPFLFAGLHHLLYLALGGRSGLALSPDWLMYLAYLIPTALLTGGNEEPGWRGYITPVLLKRFNLYLSHVIVGVCWALWHLPLYSMEGWGSDEQPILWMVIYCIPLSMILTWLYFKSRRSILPVMLFHAGSNIVSRYFPMNTRIFENLQDEYTVIKAVLYGLIALILLLATKGTLGYKNEIKEQ